MHKCLRFLLCLIAASLHPSRSDAQQLSAQQTAIVHSIDEGVPEALELLEAHSSSAGLGECKERRQRTSGTFSDGILLLHSKTTTNDADDGYREEAAFYYLTCLENLPGAILAIDGKSGDSWLFLDTKQSGDVRPGAEAERKLDIQHVADWRELEGFLAQRIVTGSVVYFEPGPTMLPETFSTATEGQMPAWVQVLQKKWSTAEFRSVGRRLNTLYDSGLQTLHRGTARGLEHIR